MTRLEQKVIVRCKRCEWRIFDKVTMTTGNIEIKCPKCGYVNEIDLSLRRGNLKFRTFTMKQKLPGSQKSANYPLKLLIAYFELNW